jgi:hypothetical protein
MSENDSTFDFTISDVHETMGQKWDSYLIDLNITTCTKLEISNLIQKWPIKGISVDKRIIDQAKEMFVELSYSYGREDPTVWLNYLKEAGEKVRKNIEEGTREGLIKTYQISEEKLAKDAWDLLLQSAITKKRQSNWTGLCTQGASVHLFKQTEGTLPEPGKELQSLRSHKVSYPHVAESPVSMGDIFLAQKEVLFSDITFFVSHSNNGGGHIEPYVMRSWYDTANERWRPFLLSYFPDRNAKIEISTIPIF